MKNKQLRHTYGRLYRLAAVTILSSLALHSQAPSNATSTLSSAQEHFFRYAFKTFANPTDTSATRARREQAFANRFGLNQAERGTLHAVALQCYQTSLGVYQQVQALSAGKAVLSPSALAALAALDSQQTVSLNGWATELLSQMRPEVLARFNLVIASLPQK